MHCNTAVHSGVGKLQFSSVWFSLNKPLVYCSSDTSHHPSESASSSKWHAWFASRCPGRRLSTWPTTAVSCPTALGALCGQLTFRLAWCRQHSVVMATELLQPRDLACGTLFQSSCVILTYGLFRRQLKGHLFREA